MAQENVSGHPESRGETPNQSFVSTKDMSIILQGKSMISFFRPIARQNPQRFKTTSKKHKTHANFTKITMYRTNGPVSKEYIKRKLLEDCERPEREVDFS
jgi:hypothetical protein